MLSTESGRKPLVLPTQPKEPTLFNTEYQTGKQISSIQIAGGPLEEGKMMSNVPTRANSKPILSRIEEKEVEYFSPFNGRPPAQTREFSFQSTPNSPDQDKIRAILKTAPRLPDAISLSNQPTPIYEPVSIFQSKRTVYHTLHNSMKTYHFNKKHINYTPQKSVIQIDQNRLLKSRGPMSGVN